MKNFTSLLLVLVMILFSSATLLAQATYTDDFGVAKDYKTDALTGSIWDGFMIDGASAVTDNLVELNTTTNAGSLTISAMNTAWAPDAETGFYLFKNLKGKGADFDAKVKITTGTFPSTDVAVGYFMPGIMARAKNAPEITFVQTQAFDRNDFNGAVFRIWNAPDVEALGDESWCPRNKALADIGLGDIAAEDFTIKNYPWIRLAKIDGYVSSYVSKDGETWYKIWETERFDFDDYDMQIGLCHSTYTDQTGVVAFDNFSVIDYSDNGVSNKEIKSNIVKAFFSNDQINISTTEQISSVKLYGIDGALKFNKEIKASSISIPVSQKGMYVLVSEVAGKTYTQKIAAF